jgi:carbon storage regulator
MLVLSRKPGERVLVGEDIEVVVLEVEGDRVKLGFTAPRYVPICRAEIHRELADCLAASDRQKLSALPLGFAETHRY